MNNNKETHVAFYDFELLGNDGEKVIFKENKILILTQRDLTITLKAKKHLQESCYLVFKKYYIAINYCR